MLPGKLSAQCLWLCGFEPTFQHPACCRIAVIEEEIGFLSGRAGGHCACSGRLYTVDAFESWKKYLIT